MRRIVLYIRQAFCKHEFKFEERHVILNNNDIKASGIKIYIYCEKCGFHVSYWKYNFK